MIMKESLELATNYRTHRLYPVGEMYFTTTIKTR